MMMESWTDRDLLWMLLAPEIWSSGTDAYFVVSSSWMSSRLLSEVESDAEIKFVCVCVHVVSEA